MTFQDREELKEQLVNHESFRRFPYWDCCSKGLRIACPKSTDGSHKGKLTLGIGRNIEDRGISSATGEQMCEEDIDLVLSQLTDKFPWFEKLDGVRKRVLMDMCFNMGLGGLLTFHNTLTLIEQGRYDAAATNMLLSLWAKQTGQRAHTLARMMRDGK